MTLTSDEFRDALAKGMGRAVRHVRESSAESVREALLDACVQCKAYDTQCEGFRADWLYRMIELTGEPNFYRTKILEAIPPSRDADSYDFWQMYYLAYEFALRGDAECREAIYREFDLLVDDNNIGGAKALVDLDGIPGLLHVLEIAGRRITNGGDIWWEVSHLVIEKTGKKYGKESVQAAINAEAARNEFIRTYLERAAEDEAELQKEKANGSVEADKYSIEEWIADISADDFDDEKIRTADDDNIIARLSHRHPLLPMGRRSLSDEEIETVWSALMREENPYRLYSFLFAFAPSRRNRLPRFDPKILALVDSPHWFLSWKATQALAQLSDESIRRKALELLQAISEKRNWYDGFKLILSSFRQEDEDVVAAALRTHHFPHDVCLHGVGIDITNMAEKYPEVAFDDSLLWFYERTPCSLCRDDIVKELNKRRLVPNEIWEECLDDCNEQLRELAQNKGECINEPPSE